MKRKAGQWKQKSSDAASTTLDSGHYNSHWGFYTVYEDIEDSQRDAERTLRTICR